MARFIRSIIGYNDPVLIPWRVAINQTIKAGDLVQINATSRWLEAAVAASTTLVGIAQQSITTGGTVTVKDTITVLPLTDVVIRIPYVGTTKTSLADTDLVTTLFDLSAPGAGETTINLDDTTGGMCSVVDYDNTKKFADVIIMDAAIKKLG
jgi:hypothetical protein